MNIVPEVKCRRCGESFSSLRSRCPNCGTRRVSQSTRTPSGTPSTVSGTEAYAKANANTKWQLLFGLTLVVSVILAVVIMVSTGLSDLDKANQKTQASMPIPSTTVALFEEAPSPSPTPTPTIETIKIYFYTSDLTTGTGSGEFSMRLNTGNTPGEDVPLTAQALPLTITVDEFRWSVDQEGIVELNVDPTDSSKCTVHQIGTIPGGVLITVEAFGVTATTRCYCMD